MPRIKVRMLINDSLLGGAQMIAADLVRQLNHAHFDAAMWYLYGDEKLLLFESTLRQRFSDRDLCPAYLESRGLIGGILNTAKRLKEEHIDILHCHLPVSIIVGTLSALLVGRTRIVAHYHNTAAFNSWKINALLRIIRPFISLHICYTESVEEELFNSTHVLTVPVKKISNRSYTVLNFVDTERIDNVIQHMDRKAVRKDLGGKDEDILILMSGRMIDWKGHETVIRAMPLVLAKEPGALLLLVGDGLQRPSLENLAGNLGVASRVLFLGERTDVFSLLGASDIFASPYIYGPETIVREAVGVAILEAMGAGLPTIISDYPSAYITIHDRENVMVVVPPGDADALAGSLDRLCRGAALRSSLGRAGREVINNNFSLSHATKLYLSLYQALMTP